MLLIFDCDGVLVDSEPLSCRIDAEVLTELGVPYTAEEIARSFVGVSQKDMIARISAELHARGSVRILTLPGIPVANFVRSLK